MKLYLVLCFALFLSCRSFSQTLRVAVAANAQFVAQALKTAFENQNTAKIELVVSSSGKLTAQIEHGAPYGLFLSADMSYPGTLYQKGFAFDKPVVYAWGKLVLWTLKPMDPGAGMGFIRHADIKTIAVANPATAPYGVATIEALKKTGIYRGVQDRIVYGESISQVNQYLLSGAADVAFTAKSVVEDPAMKNKGKWLEVNDSLYRPIAQGVVVLKSARGATLDAARRFYHFLFTPQAKTIFKAYGYLVK